MEVILLEKVDNLGNIGDKVRVRPGYCRNYLLPKGKATMATPENLAAFEARRAEFEARQAAERAEANARAGRLAELKVTLSAKAGSEGKLYGSLGTVDIAEACTAAGVEVKRSEVRLPDGPIRAVGDHAVEIHLHTDVNATITISVIAEQGE
jgi:large subunit ribosomal protein L9